MQQMFFELIQIALGNREKFTQIPSEKEWQGLFDVAIKQSLAGFLLEGVQKVLEKNEGQRPQALLEWISLYIQTETTNKNQNLKSKELYERFKEGGFESCILKGQGVSRLYPKPEVRQAGDIDIWVDSGCDIVVGWMRSQSVDVTIIDYVNCHAAFYSDVEVEVHFRPTYFFNPFNNRKLQNWIVANKEEQMHHFDAEVGFAYPSIGFNLVFSLIHIYRHVFSEGIGLRQLMDYYFILTHSTQQEREAAYKTLQSFGIGKFVGVVMYVMRRVFAIDETYLLCEPNNIEGEFLLNEIMRGGNFGHFDDRNEFVDSSHRFRRGINNVKRNFRFLTQYPSEVLWMPAWKVWHWCWRKRKGYL